MTGVAMMRRHAVAVGVGLAAFGLVAACGSGGSSGQAPASESADEGSTSSEASPEPVVPDSVLVCQPGMVDTALTADDVPAWPGPPPSEFEMPAASPVVRGCGTLTGPVAHAVYQAALAHPAALLDEGRLERGEGLSDTSDALWGVDGLVEWIVVEPRW